MLLLNEKKNNNITQPEVPQNLIEKQKFHTVGGCSKI